MTIKNAAKMLGMSEQTLRLWLQNGTCPFGTAIPGRGQNYRYYINETRLNVWITGQDIKSANSLETEALSGTD